MEQTKLLFVHDALLSFCCHRHACFLIEGNTKNKKWWGCTTHAWTEVDDDFTCPSSLVWCTFSRKKNTFRFSFIETLIWQSVEDATPKLQLVNQCVLNTSDFKWIEFFVFSSNFPGHPFHRHTRTHTSFVVSYSDLVVDELHTKCCYKMINRRQTLNSTQVTVEDILLDETSQRLHLITRTQKEFSTNYFLVLFTDTK